MTTNMENPPPSTWPSVQHDWFRASATRDADGWRACLTDDVRSIGVDGSVTARPDAVVSGLVAYYDALDPQETVDQWIRGDEGDVFVWHGRIEPGSEGETRYCTVCTLRDGRIAEIRFFADPGALGRLLAARSAT